ncbi:MAG: GDSL-type esterase/lipase family protein, partial [Candidatus Staskawiczbacteria bacterium]
MHKFNQPTKLGNERERVNSFPKNFSFHFLKTTVILFCLGFLFFAENVGATTPDQISGLKLWLDASQGVTTDGTTPAVDGNTVQQWNDQSIGGYNAIQLTADSKPIYKTNVMNGKPVVRFGGGQKIITSNFLDSSFNTSLTFFIVTATDNRGIQISTSNQGTTWYTGNDSGAIFETDNLSKQQSMMKDVGGISLSNPTIETLVYNGSQKVMHLNGISNTLSATGNLGLSGALTIGTLSTVDMFSYTGDIAEIIVYNSVLTDTQVEQIESYLMSKYGITPPPSISTLPSLIFDGDSLTSGNGADGGYDYPSQVQRQYNGITTVKNFGVPSQTLQAMLTTALTRIDPEYQASRPENILTIWGGTNDLYFGSGNESDITNTYNNLVSYVNDRKTIGYKVIVNTILPRSGYATPDTYFEAHRQAYNTLIRNNWKTFADAIADVASDSRIGDFGDE